MNRRTFLAAGAVSAIGCAALRGGPGARQAVERRSRLPNVPLQTHEGRTVRFYDDLVRGRIVMLNFMYARCQNICPGMTSNLALVQRALGKRVGRDIFMYSITLKPEEDTAAVLKSYAATHGVKPGWLFLTGGCDDVETLRRRSASSIPTRPSTRTPRSTSAWSSTGTTRSTVGRRARRSQIRTRSRR